MDSKPHQDTLAIMDFDPMFVNVVKRVGYFFMERETYNRLTVECEIFHRYKMTFFDYLYNNGMGIMALPKANMYKIYEL